MISSTRLLQKRVVQKLGYLIGLTRIIDRNREDGLFSDRQDGTEDRGVIHYVFDTNVIQMFFEPFRNPHFCEVFFGNELGGDAVMADEINAQNCLIAAEYLFSGLLPGQVDDGRWYMSASHKDELETQIGHLRADVELVDKALEEKPRFRKDSARLLQRLNSALKFEERDREYVINLAAKAGFAKDKIEQLASLSDQAFERRAIEIRSREVCRSLALDNVFEPRWQLDRFHTDPELLAARRDLEILVGIDAQSSDIRREARGWQTALSTVLARRGGNVRSETAVAADCETLALIDWANRNVLPPNERIVFVTGDRAVLEAYRSRYVDEPGSGPFLLRPISHFAPLFNPRSANSILVSKQFAFQAIQEALEGAMLALNLGLFTEETSAGKSRARDHFANMAEREPEKATKLVVKYFPAFRDEAWLRIQERKLSALVDQLRPIELLMLEAYPQLIAERLEDSRSDFITGIKTMGGAVDREIVEHLAGAKRAGLKFALPLMGDAVRDLLDRIARRPPDVRVRALIPLKLSFTEDPNQYVFYEDEQAKLKAASPDELGEHLAALIKVPPQIFALAAMLTFGLERWKDAARYSALAANAATSDQRKRPLASAIEDQRELAYLNAVSIRFRLSAWDPEHALAHRDPLRDWLLNASAELTTCEQYYRENEYLSRELRSVSERASLHVSYCEWLVFGPPELADQYDDPGGHALEQLSAVTRDLRACATLVDPAGVRAEKERSVGRTRSKLVLNSAILQFSYNILGARLAGEALADRWESLRDDVSTLIETLPEPRELHWDGKPDLAEAYLASTAGDLDRLNAINLDKVTLALDRAIIRGLQALLVRRQGHDDPHDSVGSEEVREMR